MIKLVGTLYLQNCDQFCLKWPVKEDGYINVRYFLCIEKQG